MTAFRFFGSDHAPIAPPMCQLIRGDEPISLEIVLYVYTLTLLVKFFDSFGSIYYGGLDSGEGIILSFAFKLLSHSWCSLFLLQ